MCIHLHMHICICIQAFAWGTNQCGELGNGNGGVACSLEPRHVDLSTFFEGGMRRIEVCVCLYFRLCVCVRVCVCVCVCLFE